METRNTMILDGDDNPWVVDNLDATCYLCLRNLVYPLHGIVIVDKVNGDAIGASVPKSTKWDCMISLAAIFTWRKNTMHRTMATSRRESIIEKYKDKVGAMTIDSQTNLRVYPLKLEEC